MAAAVANELTQTFLDKPWANAYPLSFLPGAGNAVRPTSSVRGGYEPVELDIELPVEEWGERRAGREEDAHDTEGTASTKRQREEEQLLTPSRDKRARTSTPQPDLPLSIVRDSPASSRGHKKKSKKKKKKGRVQRHLASPPFPYSRPPVPARPAANDSHNFVFDFAASPAPGEQRFNGPVFASSSSVNLAHSESPILTHDMLFPSLRGLAFPEYRPLLLDQPITPVWSATLYELMLQFFHFCVPREQWSNMPGRLVMGETKFWIVRQVTALQPNRPAIQSIYQPGRAPGYYTLAEHMKSKFRAMLDAMQWLFDNRSLTVDAVAHLHAERELTQHLNSLRRISPHQAAAIVLLRWLQSLRTPNRHYVFFAHPDGSLRFNRSEPPWAWWFKRVEVGDPCTAEVLDEWEKGVRAEEDWSDF
ncbi:hypothetical protein JCM10296v2_005506 [Rhodotorula toruloides]